MFWINTSLHMNLLAFNASLLLILFQSLNYASFLMTFTVLVFSLASIVKFSIFIFIGSFWNPKYYFAPYKPNDPWYMKYNVSISYNRPGLLESECIVFKIYMHDWVNGFYHLFTLNIFWVIFALFCLPHCLSRVPSFHCPPFSLPSSKR